MRAHVHVIVACSPIDIKPMMDHMRRKLFKCIFTHSRLRAHMDGSFHAQLHAHMYVSRARQHYSLPRQTSRCGVQQLVQQPSDVLQVCSDKKNEKNVLVINGTASREPRPSLLFAVDLKKHVAVQLRSYRMHCMQWHAHMVLYERGCTIELAKKPSNGVARCTPSGKEKVSATCHYSP
jgi:hypothetical protein